MALDAGSVAVRVGADFSGQGFDRYDRAVSGARAMAAKAVKVTLGSEADEGGFDRWDRRVATERAKAARPIEQKFKVDVDLGGLLAAKAGTAALTKESSALSDVFNRSRLSIGQWLVLLGSGLPIIVDLGAALGALTASAGAAMAGLGALATGAAGALTVGFGGIAAIAAPAISQLTDLIAAQQAANKAQTTGAAAAGRASEASAHQITAAREQVTVATQGVTRAEEQLETTQESAKIAQDALTQAREDAERQLQDMRRAAMGADATEESARIALRRAELELRHVRMDAASGALDIREAENEVALARINLRDVTISGNRAQADYNEARRGGIREMPGVVSAEQAYDSALASVEQAQDGVRDAERARRNALRDLTYQQRQANAATGAGGTALAALALAQQKAGPAAVAFARQLKSLGHEWRGLTRTGRTDFFGMLSDGVDRLQDKLPMLARSANRSMAALRDGFDEFLDRAAGPEFDTFVHTMTRTFERVIGPVSRGFGNIAIVLERIAVAVAPEVVKVAEGFEGMTQGWRESTRNAGELRDTVGGLVDHAQAWWELLVASKDLIVAALVPGMGEGKDAVEGITDQFEEWTKWLNAHPDDVRKFFKDGMDTAAELGDILLGMIVTLKDISDFLRPIVHDIIDVVQALNSVKVGNVSALEALLAAFVAFKGAQKIKDASTAIRDMYGSLRGSARRAKDLFETARLWGMYAREGVADFMGNIVSGIRTRAGRVRTAIGNALKTARTFVTSAATGAAEFVGSMVGSIRNSRLANSLRSIFRRIALRLGAVMASTIAAAVAVGEGIGGAVSSIPGRLEKRLPPGMRGAGRVAGRAFAVAFIAAAALLIFDWAMKLREKFQPGSSPSNPLLFPHSRAPQEGGPLLEGSPLGVDLGVDVGPVHFQHGGRAERGGTFLVGEAGPELFVPDQAGQVVPNGQLRGGAMAGLAGFGRAAEGEGRRGSQGFVKALTDGGRKAKTVAERLRKDTLDEFTRIRKGSGEDTEKMRKRTVDDFDTARDKAVDSTKDLRRRVGDTYRDLERDHGGELRKMRGNAERSFGAMADTAKGDSRRLTGSVTGSMRDVSSVVFRGMSYIVRATNKALQAFDVKRVDLNLDAPRLRQRGGHLPGGKTGDRNMLFAEDDEYVLNRNVTRGMGKGFLDWLNFKAFPRFQRGGGVGGGMSSMVAEADKFERKHFPYVWGGGHGSFGIQPVDCSGAVSQVLHAAGLLDAPMVSGDLARWGKAGKGPLTVYANPEHVLMSLNGRFFGTSSSNPGGGAGWIGDPGISYLSRFAARTMGVEGAERVKRLLIRGTRGPMRDIAQAAVDRGRAGANAYIDRKMPSGTWGGGDAQADGDVERIFAQTAKRYATSRTATMALGEAGYAETGMQDAPGGMGSSEGALQLLASTAAAMGIDPHNEGSVAAAFLLRGFTGRGGANALAAQGLPAHLVAQGVQGSFDASGSNYAAKRSLALRWMARFGLQRGGLVGPGGDWQPNQPRARRRWRGALGDADIGGNFDDLFEAIGASRAGMAGGAEHWLLNTGGDPDIRHAQRIEDRILRNLRREERHTRHDADRRIAHLHDPVEAAWTAVRKARAAERHGDMSHREVRDVWAHLQAIRDRYQRSRRRVRRGEDRRLGQLEAQRGDWRGRTDRRIESQLRAGFGQLGQFQDARAELFSTFGSNFVGPRGGGGVATGADFFGAAGGAVPGGPFQAAGGAFGGSRVYQGDLILNNYFRESPKDPHTWARGAMFELRAAT